MREVVALLFAITVVVLGWKQPLRDQVGSFFPGLNIAPSRISQLAARASQRAAQQKAAERAEASGERRVTQQTQDNSWMWGPTSLDRKK